MYFRSSWDVYGGTFYDQRTEFDLLHGGNQVFERNFDGSDTDVVSLTNNTISLPNHYFVTGEEVTYSVQTSVSCSSTTGIGTTGDRLGIGATYFPAIGTPGIGATLNYVPQSVFIIKVNNSSIRLARTAEDALKSIAVPLDLTSVGIGSSHSITSKRENTRALISIDNIIQSPIVNTQVAAALTADLSKKTDILYISGITSFFSGDDIRIDQEIMKGVAVGPGAGGTGAGFEGWPCGAYVIGSWVEGQWLHTCQKDPM